MSDLNASLLARRGEAIPRGPFNVAPLFVARASGSTVWDVEGREYLDFCGGIGVVNVGHNHPRVVQAIKDQADALVHGCWHVVMYEPYLELAERLNEIAPMPGPNKTVLFNSGAEANENAVKVARAATERAGVVVFERGFHGRTLLALTMTGKVDPYRRGFGPFAPAVFRLPYEPFFGHPGPDDQAAEAAAREALAHLFAYQSAADNVACVVVEPVLGEGGFLPIRPGAYRALRSVCDEHGILLVADEVQTGFGRCGAYFASERYGIEPDLVVMAKSLAGGMPLSALTGRAELMDAPQIGGLGGTYGGNPLSCAAALAVLDIIEEEGLLDRAEVLGARVQSAFEDMAAKHAFLAHPRGLGAMRGIEVVDPATGQPDGAMAKRLLSAARERGLLIMTASGNVVRTLMPLTLSDAQLDRGLSLLGEAATEVAR